MSDADRRIPSLDGMRGVLLIVVLTAHLLGTRNFPISREALPVEGLAYTAMRFFFIISGFLITGILLNEITKRGTIRLGRFYFKRTFRIFPAYYTFVAIVAIASAFGFFQLNPGDLAHAVTYTSNYNPDKAWQFGHTWSVSVEEQFYLLWPVVLVLIGLRRAVFLLAGLVVVLPFWRVALLGLPPNAFGLGIFQEGIGHTFDTTADVIAVGCLLAVMRSRLWAYAPYRRLLESRRIAGVFLLVLVVPLASELGNWMDGFPRYALLTAHELLGVPLVNLCLAVLVDWAMRYPQGSVGRVLNHPFWIRLGMLSYSTYLWQQVFLNRHSQHVINAFPLNLILALTFGWVSYKLVEHPWLAFRDRVDARLQARSEPAPVKSPPVVIPEVAVRSPSAPLQNA